MLTIPEQYKIFPVSNIVIVVVIFLRQLYPRGKGGMRLTLYEALTCETRPDHNTRPTTCPTLFDKRVGSLTSPANHITLKMQDSGVRFVVFISEGSNLYPGCRYNVGTEN